MNFTSEDNLKIIGAKISTLLAIGVLSFCCGVLPYYTIRVFRNRFPTSAVHQITSGVICFSGGTLLGVTFLHLLPEVREKIARLQSEYDCLTFPKSLPLSDIIAMSGFFGVYVLDELLHMCVEWYSVKMKFSGNLSTTLIKKGSGKMKKICSQLPNEVSVFSLDNHEHNKHQTSTIHKRSVHHASPMTSCVCQSPKLNPGEVSEEKEIFSINQEGEANEEKLQPEQQQPVPKSEHKLQELPVSDSKLFKKKRSEIMPPISGLLTIAALSFHDIFEGIAIGIEQDLEAILFLYLSIASHKYAIAFCIGMDLVTSGSHLKLIVLSMMTFSVVSPIGVIVGMIVVAKSMLHDYEVDSPLSVVMQGIAGGTLIYVVCFEVLQREGTDTHKKGIQNVMFVICGFLVTLGFKVLTGHSHSR